MNTVPQKTIYLQNVIVIEVNSVFVRGHSDVPHIVERKM